MEGVGAHTSGGAASPFPSPSDSSEGLLFLAPLDAFPE